MTQLKNIIKWSIVFQLFVAFKTGLCFSNFFYPEINPTYLTPDNNIPLSELKAESRYWNGTWWGTSVSSGNNAVVNSTLLGYGTGFLLASAFFLHTMASIPHYHSHILSSRCLILLGQNLAFCTSWSSLHSLYVVVRSDATFISNNFYQVVVKLNTFSSSIVPF